MSYPDRMVEHSDLPLVDIVIPVHSTTRPLERAVSSALLACRGAGPGQCRVTVVGHHLTEAQVRDMLSPEYRDVVHVIESEDRGATAAVPRNEALRRTTARYVSFLDSDDTLDPGAVTRWLGIAQRRGSDLVIPFQHHEGDRVDITPVTRPFRSARLDAVKDRLGYRSSAFGLARTSAAREVGARFDENVRTGEDQAFIVALYTGGRRIDFAPGTPGCVVHTDADVRVSRQPLPLRDEVAALLDLVHEPWFGAVSTRFRTSYVLKYIRVNFFPALDHAVRSGEWGPERARGAAAVWDELVGFAPHVAEQLSRADGRVGRLLHEGADQAELLAALAARRRFATPAALLTQDLRWALARQAPLRIAAAGAVQIVRYRAGLAGLRRRR